MKCSLYLVRVPFSASRGGLEDRGIFFDSDDEQTEYIPDIYYYNGDLARYSVAGLIWRIRIVAITECGEVSPCFLRV